MIFRLLIFVVLLAPTAFSQTSQSGPPIEPGVSQALAQWRAARYSNVRYKLNLTLEKMSPVLKGTIEIRVKVNTAPGEQGTVPWGVPIVLDWRKIRGSESLSTVSNASVNGENVTPLQGAGRVLDVAEPVYENRSEHLIFMDAVRPGENVIKLDFTSPILTSGSAITRYVDKEDGAEYIYSLFVPSDASTAFPIFDQPDLKARFTLGFLSPPADWKIITNTPGFCIEGAEPYGIVCSYEETKPISTYVFAFAAGPFEAFADKGGNLSGSEGVLVRDKGSTSPTPKNTLPTGRVSASDADPASHIYVRRSQAAKFKPHAAEVFRLNREGVKYLETYFDYKFPFPKYDLVLIPEFPFGGMEHAGATFLREASIIFPTEPTKSDHISRANLIFHEAAHQWFGDTVTMRWFDDLWLKEGFAEFMAYKTLEKVMPEANAWKVFYERNKQAAYATDSTKGTTPIYQKIDNLSAAKSAYGNIVYRKAPSFLRQAEFYLGEQKFQTAARAFLKKHEYANAGWEDLMGEFEAAGKQDLKDWANAWIKRAGVPIVKANVSPTQWVEGQIVPPRYLVCCVLEQTSEFRWPMLFNTLIRGSRAKDWTFKVGFSEDYRLAVDQSDELFKGDDRFPKPLLFFPNYQDYGYGIFLLDDKSRDYVLKNIQNEKDPFLRSMMWGALWDSVREAELDPKVYVERVISSLSDKGGLAITSSPKGKSDLKLRGANPESDETIIASIIGRAVTALIYYLPTTDIPLTEGRASTADRLRWSFEDILLDKLQHAPTAGQRITFYRAFVTTASTAKGREVLKEMLTAKQPIPLRTKDRFDIVTRLIILGDADAPKLLAQLEKSETGDDAKRYAYAARAGIATAENKAKYWSDFTANKDISESWIEAAFGPFNSVRHSDLTLPYLERALAELPNHKRTRKIFFVNGWLGAFIGGQKSESAAAIVNKFVADNPNLDRDLRLKILENVDLIERAVKIRGKYP